MDSAPSTSGVSASRESRRAAKPANRGSRARIRVEPGSERRQAVARYGSQESGCRGAATEMKTRDAQVRDALLTVLGHKTVEDLTNIVARDTLKVELKAAVSELFPEGTVTAIYLPQFVIQ